MHRNAPRAASTVEDATERFVTGQLNAQLVDEVLALIEQTVGEPDRTPSPRASSQA